MLRILSWDVGLRTLSYCLLSGSWTEEGEMTFQVEDWNSIDVQTDEVPADSSAKGTGATSKAKRAKVAAVSVEDGARLVMDTLHRRARIFEALNHIIIEQQPAGGHNRHSNVRMKVVSHVLQCYFYTRMLFQPQSGTPEISFVSPASKLVDMEKAPRKSTKKRTNEETADEALPPPPAAAAPDTVTDAKPKKVESNYARNKKYAVAKTGELIATLPETSDARKFFTAASTAKKDDLADAFLLGYYFLKKQAPKRSKRSKKSVAIKIETE